MNAESVIEELQTKYRDTTLAQLKIVLRVMVLRAVLTSTWKSSILSFIKHRYRLQMLNSTLFLELSARLTDRKLLVYLPTLLTLAARLKLEPRMQLTRLPLVTNRTKRWTPRKTTSVKNQYLSSMNGGRTWLRLWNRQYRHPIKRPMLSESNLARSEEIRKL